MYKTYHPTYDELYRLYITEQKSTREVAKYYGATSTTIPRWLRAHGIEPRPGPKGLGERGIVPPTYDELYKLYITERKSTRAIGKFYGVSKTEVRRWLIAHGIECRPIYNGVKNRGIVPPTKDELYELVYVKHHSYDEIAVIFGVDGTTIPNWLKKHGNETPSVWYTRRNGFVPKVPTKEELEHLYLEQGLSLTQIGQIYGGVGHHTIANFCHEYQIKIRPDGYNGGHRITCLDGHRVRSTYEFKVDNWLYDHDVPHTYEPQLPFDPKYSADFLANGWYIEVWGVSTSEYRLRKSKKVELYQAHNAPLIQIPSWSFGTKYKGLWERKLAKVLNPIT